MTKAHSQTGRVTFLEGRGDLPMMEIVTPWSAAEIYLHGGHVTHFQKNNEPPLLFLSQCSNFSTDKPIRGGIPIIFPWFGKPENQPVQHGFARIQDWELRKMISPADGSVTVHLQMPKPANAPEWSDCSVEYIVTVNETLTAELAVTNESSRPIEFEDCLHTYFEVGEIGMVEVSGLRGVTYLDQPAGFAQKTETDEVIRIASEVDRIYLNTEHTVEIRDRALKRTICVEKSGSISTVVWNPWVAKSKAMQDFCDEEYQKMICVESGNIAQNKRTLPPSQTARLRIKLSSAPLA